MSITERETCLDNMLKILSGFPVMSLSDMQATHLMSRVDCKYVFRLHRLPPFLMALKDHYRVLEVNGRLISEYQNQYFDTPELKSYHDHHNARLNRYKVRLRKYPDSGHCFLEVKRKTNKGATFKERVPATSFSRELSTEQRNYLSRYIQPMPAGLLPSLSNSFRRITLIDELKRERVTLDVMVHFRNQLLEKQLEHVVIAEVKQEVPGHDSSFSRLMQRERIFPISFSKYCIGMLLTHPGIKYNRFKPKLTAINKLTDDVA